MLLAFEILSKLYNRLRSFNARNLQSVGQRASKLPALKLLEWFNPGRSQIQANWFKWGLGQVADFFLRSPALTSSNFKALWSTDLILTILKEITLVKNYTKNQEASCIFRIIFAHSKSPHFHRAYSTTICKRGATTVYVAWH